jgi:hypothetical protein
MRNNIAASLISSYYFAGFFTARRALPKNADELGASIGKALYKGEKKP